MEARSMHAVNNPLVSGVVSTLVLLCTAMPAHAAPAMQGSAPPTAPSSETGAAAQPESIPSPGTTELSTPTPTPAAAAPPPTTSHSRPASTPTATAPPPALPPNVASSPESSEFAAEVLAEQDQGVPDLGDLDLVNLLDMEITVASKKAEKASDAPGLVSAWSRQDIELLGYTSLADLANITTGYSVAPLAFGERGYETRGQYVSAFENDKHLTLVDGIPINFTRSYKAPVEHELPVFMAERVEFLRGPGSALYGVSAFAGVVSLVSPHLEEKGALVRARTSLGSYNLTRSVMADAVVRGDQGLSHVSASYYGRDASRTFLGDSKLEDERFRNYNDENSAFVYASHTLTRGPLEGLGLGVIYMRRTTGLGEYWWGPSSAASYLTWETFVPYLRFRRHLREDVSINAYAKLNIGTEEGGFTILTHAWDDMGGQQLYGAYARRTIDGEALVEVDWHIGRGWNLIAGVNYDARQAAQLGSWDGAVNSPALGQAESAPLATWTENKDAGGLFNTLSSYLQLQKTFPVLSGLLATAGVREDLGWTRDFRYLQFSPRVGLVQKFTDEFNLKFLYGRALRAPTVKSVGLNAEARTVLDTEGASQVDLDAIPDVVAETIDSIEGGFNFSHRMFGISVAAFWNKILNALGKDQYEATTTPNEVTVNTFINDEGASQAWGLEVETGMALDFGLTARINFAYARARDPDGLAFAWVPVAKTNFVLSYQIPKTYRASLAAMGHWVYAFREGGEFSELSDTGRFNLDLNLRLPIHSGIGVEFQVRNLIGEVYRDPGYTYNETVLEVPLPGRSFMGTLTWQL